MKRPFAPRVAGRGDGRRDAGSALSRSLSELIEYDIIPRLIVAHAGDHAAPPVSTAASLIFAREVEEFAPLVMQVEADALIDEVEAILARGVSFEAVLVDLLAPTARLLGQYWEDDRCDFVEVTMGLWRLQEVVNEISIRRPPRRSPRDPLRALFASMPGDQHTLGTVLIDDIFRADGWLTERICDGTEEELAASVAGQWFDLIGLTVTCDCHMAPLPSLIAALRKGSRNPGVCVMVGGRIFSADPHLAQGVGADGTAPDARFAPRMAVELIREREWGAVI